MHRHFEIYADTIGVFTVVGGVVIVGGLTALALWLINAYFAPKVYRQETKALKEEKGKLRHELNQKNELAEIALDLLHKLVSQEQMLEALKDVANKLKQKLEFHKVPLEKPAQYGDLFHNAWSQFSRELREFHGAATRAGYEIPQLEELLDNKGEE